MDTNFATGITHALDRISEDAIGSVLRRFGSEIDLNRRLVGRRRASTRRKHDRLHRLTDGARRRFGGTGPRRFGQIFRSKVASFSHYQLS